MPFVKNIIIILLVAFSSTFAQDYLWPTDASKLITSSFCEFRPRHFHAALDIKTWGQVGYKIYAIEDGYIYRVRVSSSGYGKAIYLKLKDGNIVVYGHLNGFIPALEAYTDSLRLSTMDNTLDIFPKPNQFPVKKGDLLGYTGDTGIGVPHLHFEMRDSKNRPINPLQFYRDEITDTEPPLLQQLAIIPLSVMTLINFQPDTLLINLRQHQKIIISEPIYLTGKAFIAVKSYDQANGATNRFSFYQANLFVNDSLVYEVKYDRFSYAEERLVELDKNFSLWRKGVGVFHNFYRHPYNSLSFYENSNPQAGMLSEKSLREGLNRIALQIFDYHGNESDIELQVVYHSREQLQVFDFSALANMLLMGLKSNIPVHKLDIEYLDDSQRLPAHRQSAWRPPDFQIKLLNNFMDNFYYSLSLPIPPGPQYSIIKIKPYDENGVPLLPCYIKLNEFPADSGNASNSLDIQKIKFSGDRVAILSGNPSPLFKGIDLDPAFTYQPDPYTNYSVINVDTLKKHLGGYLTGSLNQIQNWVQVTPGENASVQSPDNMVKLDFQFDAVYDTFFCNIEIENAPHDISSDYPVMTQIYNAQPFYQALNRGAYLSFAIPDSISGIKGLGVYYWHPKRGWLYLPAKYTDDTHTYRTRITSLEKFAVIKDELPPYLVPVNQSYSGKIYLKNAPLKISVRDKMAGIYNQEQISVFIDERWTLFRYDPEEDLVIVSLNYIPKGEHKLRISATDNVGNQTTSEYIIVK